MSWYYRQNDISVDNLTEQELRRKLVARELHPDGLVWHATLADWTVARTVFPAECGAPLTTANPTGRTAGSVRLLPSPGGRPVAPARSAPLRSIPAPAPPLSAPPPPQAPHAPAPAPPAFSPPRAQAPANPAPVVPKARGGYLPIVGLAALLALIFAGVAFWDKLAGSHPAETRAATPSPPPIHVPAPLPFAPPELPPPSALTPPETPEESVRAFITQFYRLLELRNFEGLRACYPATGVKSNGRELPRDDLVSAYVRLKADYQSLSYHLGEISVQVTGGGQEATARYSLQFAHLRPSGETFSGHATDVTKLRHLGGDWQIVEENETMTRDPIAPPDESEQLNATAFVTAVFNKLRAGDFDAACKFLADSLEYGEMANHPRLSRSAVRTQLARRFRQPPPPVIHITSLFSSRAPDGAVVLKFHMTCEVTVSGAPRSEAADAQWVVKRQGGRWRVVYWAQSAAAG